MQNSSLTTDRCHILALSDGDREDVVALLIDPKVRTYLGGALDAQQAQTKFQHMISTKTEWHWAVRLRTREAFVGLVSIGPHHDGDHHEVSYQFSPSFWGQGLAEESLRAIINWAKTDLKLGVLVAETQEDNTKSKALLARLGMSPLRRFERFGERQVLFVTQP